MSEHRPLRWPLQRLRLGLVAALLLAIAGFVFLRQASTQAGTAPFAPQTAAFFPSDTKLLLAVALLNPQERELAGKLDVELLGADGKILARASQAVRQQAAAVGYRFELAAAKASAAGLTLRCRLAGQTFETPLARVLLHKGHETAFTSSLEFYAGSTAPFRCDVHGARSARETLPLPGAEVTVRLKEKDGKFRTLYTGRANKDGRADAAFEVPALPTGQYVLEVTTRSALGEEKLERAVRIIADAKLLLVTDKPIYQPGQMIHIRALALRPFDLKPVANTDLLFEVEDGKGNKVFKKTLKTSVYGIASVDFQLADEVNVGNYNLRAVLGDQRAEKTVAVKRYVLPKFKANVTSDKTFYLPKEIVKAELQSDYFFGKPVAHAKVEVTAETFDVAFRKFHTWKGKTDANGHAKFEIQLPDYFVGQPLQKGNAIVKLDVKVTDTADHSETIARSYTVSEQPIVLSLIPEGGKLVPGMENRVFAATVYPDGSPAPNTEVKLWLGKEAKGEPIATVKTNDAGLAELKVTPKAEQFRQGNAEQRNIEMLGGVQVGWMPTVLLDVRAEARDAKGNTATRVAELNSHPLGENVLLRLDKAIYRAGDRLNAEVRTSAGLPTVYLDITRGGQLVLSRWMEVKDGKATHRLDLPQTAFGSLEVHAYQMLHTGEIIRDSRVVYVQPRNDLKIDVKADKTVHLPGENGRIRFHVTDSEGQPTAAALGVIVVDEAVYALQDLQPGLEKVYFTLQEELLKPQVQVKLRPSDTLDNLIRRPVLPALQNPNAQARQQQLAEVLLTSVKVRPPARWDVEPALQRKLQFDGQVAQIGWGLYHFASNNESAIQYDEKAGKWAFRPDVLQAAANAGNINGAVLNAPFGGKLTLAELARTEKQFDVDHLARALTRHRMERLSVAFVQYSDANKAKWLKDGRWTFPAAVLSEAAASQGLDASWLRDGWGQGFKLVERAAQAEQQTGHSQFDRHEIVSAGPDRDYQTADDIQWTKAGKQLAAGWWKDGEAAHRTQLAQLQQRNGQGLERGGRNGGFRDERGRGLQDRDMAMPRARLPAPGAGQPPPARMDAADGAKAVRGETKTMSGPTGNGGPGAAPPVKVREYFPETMLWQPALITDDNGVANLAVNFADSITTWRLSASANSRGGALGGVSVPLKVFQDFFVDIDLPVALTQSDEVAFPVAVYNYLKTPQSVKIQLQPEAWFSLLDEGGLTRTLHLKPDEVTSVRFRIKANKIGWQPLTVKAHGSKQSDAVKRVVEVVPDGQKVERVVTDRLSGRIQQTIAIPQDAIPDASKLLVKLYPGVIAQVMEGMEGMMRMPGGCMEQTSSAAYPNVLVVDYIKKAKIASPQVLLKAEQFLNVGYQRLLTFERPGGGFDWWGNGPPLVWLSAYGLQEFADMAKVYPVDRGVIDRTQAWLLKQMDKDGTWSNIGATHSETIASMGNAKMLLTSYVAWSLLESGLPKAQLQKSIDYLRGHVNDADGNAYVLALAANALAAFDAKDDSTLQLLQRLEKLRVEVPDWKAANFPAKSTSITYARGDSVTIETTALTAMAMARTGQFTTSVNKALTYLIKAKQGNGTWGSTSATILSIKALLAGMTGSSHKGVTPFTILVNGKQAAKGKVTEENADVMQAFDLKEFTQAGANRVDIEVKGETALMYQIVGRYFEPRTKAKVVAAKPVLDVNVEYDRTKLATNDLLKAKATLKYHGPVPTYQVILDLGIAPGFVVDAGDFAELVAKKRVQKFSVTQRQVTLYLGDIRPGDVLTFDYTLRAKYPVRAQAPAAVAYEYYTPANRAVSRPVQLTVVEKR